MMSIARKYILILAAAIVAGCGGGSPEPEAFSPQVMAAAQTQVAATAVTSAQAAEVLLNTGESAYGSLFPGHKTTLTSGPFAYRFYPETGMYLGVVITQNGAYTLNGVYLVGPGFGTLASPKYMGLLTNYVSVTIDPGITYKNLSVTVTVYGQSTTVVVGSVPVPTTQVDFCGSLSTDTTINQLLQSYGATFTLTSASCSFNGTTASFSGTITMVGVGTVPFTVTYKWV
jgi:hypothetical protein